MDQEFISRIGDLVRQDRFQEARKLIDSLDGEKHNTPLLLFYEAICLYEEKNDVDCVRLLSEFINCVPNHTKANYAKFTIAICLTNLGLQEQSLLFLEELPEDYPDLQRELAHVRSLIERRKVALSFLVGVLQR